MKRQTIRFIEDSSKDHKQIAEVTLTYVPRIGETICFKSSIYEVTDLIHFIKEDQVEVRVREIK